MRHIQYLLITFALHSCIPKKNTLENKEIDNLPNNYLMVLGIAQDAGYPQANCDKLCCYEAKNGNVEKQKTSCLAIVDSENGSYYLMDATPDFRDQLNLVNTIKKDSVQLKLSGIFLTHAHIGHYLGLAQLGREVMGVKSMPVYAMPKMTSFLTQNAPWSQLISLENIRIIGLKADSSVIIQKNIKITPFLVPHRDELSETVGYKIESGKMKVLYIPDIDKWSKWNRNILEEIEKVDIALIDGTFYKNGEIAGRDMSEIPHPFIEETMKLILEAKPELKSKIKFIHLNHTNPILRKTKEREDLIKEGFSIAKEGELIEL